MRTEMRPRYYCDHCNKGNGSPSAMRRHEAGCTLNPHRVCGMCKLRNEQGGDEPAPPRDELLRILDANGFKVMCEAAHDCPACILAALRTKNRPADEDGPWSVSGPQDGRESWSYAAAKREWWDLFNGEELRQCHPGF